MSGTVRADGVLASVDYVSAAPGYAAGMPVFWDMLACSFSEFDPEQIRTAMGGLNIPGTRRNRRSGYLVKNKADALLLEVWTTLFEEKFGNLTKIAFDEASLREWLLER